MGGRAGFRVRGDKRLSYNQVWHGRLGRPCEAPAVHPTAGRAGRATSTVASRSAEALIARAPGAQKTGGKWQVTNDK